MDLSNRVAVVTGGSRGIGRAVALRLASEGAKVVVNYLSNAVAGDEVAKEIVSRGGQCIVIGADISKAKEAEGLMEAALSAYGRLDILVNNAGVTLDGLLLRMSEADWDRVMSINLKGAFLCAKAVLKPMIKQRWGRIICIGSVVGLMGNPGQANYASAKAGLIGLTRTIAREVASRGITANVVAPGFIETEMTRRLSEELRQEIIKRIPLGRFGSTEDVARVVAFLASDEASYVTGQVLNVDGGLVMA